MTTPTATARTATRAVQDLLTCTTVDGAGYRNPADLWDVLDELSTLAYSLSKLLPQARVWLAREHQAGRIENEGRLQATTTTVQEVIGDLDRAAREADELSRTLDSARAGTSRLVPSTSDGR